MLLTGAGFTKNFGGLPDEDIRNAIKDNLTNKNLKQKVKENPYEKVYQDLNFDKNGYLESDRKQFNEAVNSAYENMDNSIENAIQQLSIDSKKIS